MSLAFQIYQGEDMNWGMVGESGGIGLASSGWIGRRAIWNGGWCYRRDSRVSRGEWYYENFKLEGARAEMSAFKQAASKWKAQKMESEIKSLRESASKLRKEAAGLLRSFVSAALMLNVLFMLFLSLSQTDMTNPAGKSA